MPTESRRAYLRRYQAIWIARRRNAWIVENGPCAKCGSSDDLEVDHRDPAEKSMDPASIWSRSEEARIAELAKCQVLCRECHQKKTIAENYRPRVHGTVAMYKRGRCRCELCREAKRRYKNSGDKGATLIFVRPSDLRRGHA